MKISEMITNRYKLRMPPTVYYELLADVVEVEEEQEPTIKNDFGVDCISRAQTQTEIEMCASRYTIAKERGGMGQVEWSDQLIKVSDAVDIIRALPPVTPQELRWIPVSERLPEENTWVLCWYKYFRYGDYECMQETYGVGFYDSYGHWGGDVSGHKSEAIAWMPLPQPYVPQESEDT